MHNRLTTNNLFLPKAPLINSSKNKQTLDIESTFEGSPDTHPVTQRREYTQLDETQVSVNFVCNYSTCCS